MDIKSSTDFRTAAETLEAVRDELAYPDEDTFGEVAGRVRSVIEGIDDMPEDYKSMRIWQTEDMLNSVLRRLNKSIARQEAGESLPMPCEEIAKELYERVDKARENMFVEAEKRI